MNLSITQWQNSTNSSCVVIIRWSSYLNLKTNFYFYDVFYADLPEKEYVDVMKRGRHRRQGLWKAKSPCK